jgi:exportin-2 (importin alpha re-exporter)
MSQQLVASLSSTDYSANVGVLETAHSIFRPWRAHVRSDRLYAEINLVLQSFMTPFLQLFRQTANLLLSYASASLPNCEELAQCQVLLAEIYFDFTCQDLPPDIEDSHEEFFGPSTGWFQKFLAWSPQGPCSEVSFQWRLMILTQNWLRLSPITMQRPSLLKSRLAFWR